MISFFFPPQELAMANAYSKTALKCTDTWTRLWEGASTAVGDGRAKVSADVDQLCISLGQLTNRYVEKWRTEQAVEALKRRTAMKNLRKVR